MSNVRRIRKEISESHCIYETPFFTGKVTALALANPVVDVIIGNIIGVGDQPNLNEQSPTWKEDPDSAHKAHAYVSTRAQKSTPDNVNPNSGDNKQAEKNKNTSYKTAVSEFKREDLEKEQQSDPTLETVRAKAKNNDETYYTYNGIIFRRTNNKSDIDQTVLPKSMRQKVLQACHDSPIAGHLGINATKKRVCSRFSWPGIIRDVNKYVKSCDVCQRNCNKLPNLPIQIADIINKPFDKVAIDIVGPMMMSDSKNRYILTLVDAATRWPEAVPLKSISTTDVAKALFNIFTRLGLPKEILSDNGLQLVSKAMEEVMTMMGIQRRLSTPYHAQLNGMVERFNGSLKTMLRKLCTEKPQTWDKMIPAVLFAYREIPNVTTDVTISENLTPQQNKEARDLLQTFADSLSDIPGKTERVEHKIRLTDETAFRMKQYPLPVHAMDEVDKEINSMLASGIISKSTSPYASPITVAMKKDGAIRLCLDFRRLNKITIFDAEPIPTLDELLGKMKGAKFFTKCDLTKGHWQIPIHEDSKAYTAFQTTQGLMEFKYMPFGLSTAACTFQRAMLDTLGKLPFVVSYFDDVLIFSKSWEEHLEHIEKTLSALREAGFTVKPSKTIVGCEYINFLGHIVGNMNESLIA
ncbi:gypsy retrotransposon integrase 1 [Plakobranchus ocellatus]|uniref:Gypsy retrotransposon integrase 1 n=1 Tax=Plakobranchus ocellatus TaxID=259542 RepID=A0AAV4BZ65_9GAST|nr:gypsy retrotransposon integrase 1 [Plakobranchus ocellatus]